VAGPEKLQPLLDKNQEMFNAFVKAVEELAVLRNNLNKTEVDSLTLTVGGLAYRLAAFNEVNRSKKTWFYHGSIGV